MERISLDKEVSLSRLVYGMWRVGDDEDTSPAHVQAKIEACLAQGITTIDQADIYGGYTAEGILGGAFKAAPHLRDKLEIVSKCGIIAPAGRHAAARTKYYDTSAAHINSSVDASLREMGIDYLDLLLIHRPDPFMDHLETGAALDALVSSGKAKTIGVSNFHPHDWNLLQSAMEAPLVTNQLEISLIERSSFTNGDIAFLQEHAIAPMAWSPLGGGALFDGSNAELAEKMTAVANAAGVDTAAVAIAWLLAHPAHIMPVLGTNNLERITAISDALKVTMDRQTWFELYTAATGREVP